MYPLFETIRVEEGKIQHAEWHEKRFEYSFHKYYGKLNNFRIFEGIEVPDLCKNGIWKLKVAYNEFEKRTTFEPYELKKIHSLKIVEDNTIDYSLKYSDRSHLNNLVEQKDDCDDVLIVKNGLITDTSFCNMVFFDGKDWITPAMPLLKGTARERLIDARSIVERKILISDIKNFVSFKVINAMRSFYNVEEISVENIKA